MAENKHDTTIHDREAMKRDENEITQRHVTSIKNREPDLKRPLTKIVLHSQCNMLIAETNRILDRGNELPKHKIRALYVLREKIHARVDLLMELAEQYEHVDKKAQKSKRVGKYVQKRNVLQEALSVLGGEPGHDASTLLKIIEANPHYKDAPAAGFLNRLGKTETVVDKVLKLPDLDTRAKIQEAHPLEQDMSSFAV